MARPLCCCAHECLPDQQTVARSGERLPLQIEVRLRAAVSYGREHPCRLDEASGQSAGTGTGRPRPVTLATPRSAERLGLLGHGHEQRALEAESDRAAKAEPICHGGGQVRRAGGVDLSRLIPGGNPQAQPNRPDRTEPTSAQNTTRSSMRELSHERRRAGASLVVSLSEVRAQRQRRAAVGGWSGDEALGPPPGIPRRTARADRVGNDHAPFQADAVGRADGARGVVEVSTARAPAHAFGTRRRWPAWTGWADLRHGLMMAGQQVPTYGDRRGRGPGEPCQPWAKRLVVVNWPELRIPRI